MNWIWIEQLICKTNVCQGNRVILAKGSNEIFCFSFSSSPSSFSLASWNNSAEKYISIQPEWISQSSIWIFEWNSSSEQDGTFRFVQRGGRRDRMRAFLKKFSQKKWISHRGSCATFLFPKLNFRARDSSLRGKKFYFRYISILIANVTGKSVCKQIVTRENFDRNFSSDRFLFAESR